MSRKRWIPAALLLLSLALVGCGGGSAKKSQAPVVHVAAPGARFSVPKGWQVTRAPTTVTASPDAKGEQLVSVSVFRLLHPYRPALWPKVVPELDRAAAQLVSQLKGTLDASRTVTAAAAQARQYDISFTSVGRGVKEQLTFVLRGAKEFQLLCRWAADGAEPAACGLLVSQFRPA